MKYKVKDQNIRHNGNRYRVGSTISFIGDPPAGIRHLLVAIEPVNHEQSREKGTLQQAGEAAVGENGGEGSGTTDGNGDAGGNSGSDSSSNSDGIEDVATPSSSMQEPVQKTTAKENKKKTVTKTKV